MHFINTDTGLCVGLLKKKPYWLIVFKEMSALYSANHKNNISRVREKNTSFLTNASDTVTALHVTRKKRIFLR